MKFQLKNKSQIPHGGEYAWTDPMTGIRVAGTTWDMLLDRARSQRRANSIPMGLEFEQEVEGDLCKRYVQECEGFDPALPRKRKLTLSDVIHGTRVMIEHKLAGSPLVEQQEANRRAEICSRCPFNLEFRMPCSGTCPDLERLVKSITGAKSTPYDSNVKSCGICGCWTSSAVWLPLTVQCVSVSPDMKSAFAAVPECWKQCP